MFAVKYCPGHTHAHTKTTRFPFKVSIAFEVSVYSWFCLSFFYKSPGPLPQGWGWTLVKIRYTAENALSLTLSLANSHSPGNFSLRSQLFQKPLPTTQDEVRLPHICTSAAPLSWAFFLHASRSVSILTHEGLRRGWAWRSLGRLREKSEQK